MSDDLSPKERAILLTLLLHGPVLSNVRSEPLRLRIAVHERVRLNALGLVVSVRKTAYEHRLTDAGRSWCLKELKSGRARPGDSHLERAFYSLLVAVRDNVNLDKMFTQPQEKRMELAVRAAYKELRNEPRGGVSLGDLLDGLRAVLGNESLHLIS